MLRRMVSTLGSVLTVVGGLLGLLSIWGLVGMDRFQHRLAREGQTTVGDGVAFDTSVPAVRL